MAKREACNQEDNPSWTGLFLGDCSQHLKTGECPAIKGLVKGPDGRPILYGGGAYFANPLAIISGDSGGPNATGFYGFGIIDKNGYVVDLDVVTSGWHFTQTPVIVFSGEFKGGQKGSENIDCRDQDWDYKGCTCSGSGLVAGHKIYENVTKIFPQCSTLYDEDDWVQQLNAQFKDGKNTWRLCTEAELKFAATDNYGRCKYPATVGDTTYVGDCITSWGSGWGFDCSEGDWKKASNYCKEKGQYAPRKRCVGSWYGGLPTATCGAPITQEWQETDQYLDFGVCKKRGFKNVLAYKSWHGEPPFTAKVGCDSFDETTTSDAAGPGAGYDVKYRTAHGVWTLDMTWVNDGCVHGNSCPGDETNKAHGSARGLLDMTVNVGQKDGRLKVVNQNYEYKSTNSGTDPIFGNLRGFDRCTASCFGYFGQDVDKDINDNIVTLWNGTIRDYVTNDPVCNQSERVVNVKTTLSISDASYKFTQEISVKSWLRHCHVENNQEPIIQDEFGNDICSNYCDLLHDYVFHSLETVTVTLSDAYTVSQLHNDANELLDEWNLLDDTTYPWKTSESRYSIPKVTFCEPPPTSPIDGLTAVVDEDCDASPPQKLCNYTYKAYDAVIEWDDCTPQPDWPDPPAVGEGDFDQNIRTLCQYPEYIVDCKQVIKNRCVGNCTYDGHIVGGPAELGHFGTIDLLIENREDLCCSCNCETTVSDLIRSFGGVSQVHHITQWPTEREMQLLYAGAFVSINDSSRVADGCNNTTSALVPHDVLTKCKYAEVIQMDKPSRNFAMPCGVGSAGDWTLVNDKDTTILSRAPNDYKNQCAAPCVCETINVGEANECSACTEDGTPIKRWPQLGDKTSACGTVLDVVNGEAFITGAFVNFGSAHNALVGDYVNAYLTSPTYAVPIATGSYKIFDIPSPTSIQISGSIPSNSNAVEGWIDFAQTNDYFDNNPKGEFVIRRWHYNTFAGPAQSRGSNQYLDTRLDLDISPAISGCVPWKACDPSIVVLTFHDNSVEAETNESLGRNAFISGIPNLTPRHYGARYHYIPQQWMMDPLWTPPSKPCCLGEFNPDRQECQPPDSDDGLPAANITHTWEEDDGSCIREEDEVIYSLNLNMSVKKHHYYPMRPFVEARLTGLAIPPAPELPDNTCSFPNDLAKIMTGACWPHVYLNGMSAADYAYLSNVYGEKLTPLCPAPVAGTDYWGIYAPWAVAEKQEQCIKEKWPIEDTNPIEGQEEQ